MRRRDEHHHITASQVTDQHQTVWPDGRELGTFRKRVLENLRLLWTGSSGCWMSPCVGQHRCLDWRNVAANPHVLDDGPRSIADGSQRLAAR
jgi:hypothetical protein